MSREKAAAEGFHGAMTNPVSFASDWVGEVKAALAAADAYDAAHGIHRVSLDDATVERAARAVNSQFALQWEKLPEWVREDERQTVRAVLAAAVEAGQ